MASGNLLIDLSEQLASIVEQSGPSVVQVRARHARPVTGSIVGPGRVISGRLGERGGEVRVFAGDKPFAAEHLGDDPSTGLGILRVEGLESRPLAPAERMRAGQLVVGLGRTWSAALVASAGVVSVIGGPLRTGRAAAIEQVVRADVRVHPLGAGGPLVDVEGRLVAIASGASMRGLPLFIPAQIALASAEQIVKDGGVKRGYLGVGAHPVRLPAEQRAGRTQEAGLLVVGVASGSPAEQARVLVGDVIVGFDGRVVESHDDLLALLTGGRVGTSVPVDIIRGGELRTVPVTVGRHE